MRSLLLCVIVVTSLLGFISYTHCSSKKKSKHTKNYLGFEKSNIAGPLNLALNYCTIKSLLQKSSRVSRHCIRHWDRSYRKYCSASSSHVTHKCKRLKAKAAKLKEEWISSRLKNKRPLSICGDQNIDRDEDGCCRHVVYELGTQGCCSDVVYNTKIKGCCDGKSFDIETEACCNTTIHFVDGKQSRLCCGNISIDASRYFCFNGTILVKNGENVNSGLDHNTDINLRTTTSAFSDILVDQDYRTAVITVTVSSTVIMASILVSLLVFVFKGKKGCYKSDSAHYSRVTVKSDCTLSKNYTSRTFETNLSTHIGTDSGQNILPYVNTINTYETMPSESFIGHYQSVNQDKDVVDSETQTSDLKQLNYRNSMGKPFDVQFVFNRKNKTLQMQDSAVKFTLSDADIEEDKLCLASTFRNVYDIDKKLQLTEHERVASPAVEYYFVKTNLKEPAKVTMPFIGDPEKITVLKMESDHGSDAPIRRKVLKRKDDVTRTSDEELYEIIGPGKISINVKSLSWLVCISCNEPHNFHLDGSLYGRLEPPDDPEVSHALSASIVLYIADTIHCLDDYKQVMKDEEKKRAHLHWFRLKLSGKMSLTDCIRVSLEMDPPNIGWDHKLQSEEEDISLDDITGCHKSKQSGIPFAKTWYLTSCEQAKKLNCILTTTAQTSGPNANQTTNPDRHKVDTYLLYDHLDKRTPDVKKATASGHVSDIVQPTSHFQQPTSAANNVQYPNPPVLDQAPALQHHVNVGLVRAEMGSPPP